MARVFITGSADGLGQLAADSLIAQGHKVVFHARNEKRGQEALDNVPGAETVVTADLSSVDETKRLASKGCPPPLGVIAICAPSLMVQPEPGRQFSGLW